MFFFLQAFLKLTCCHDRIMRELVCFGMLAVCLKVYNADLSCIKTRDMSLGRPIVHLSNTTAKGRNEKWITPRNKFK